MGKAIKSVKKFVSDPKRAVTAAVTMGGSEVLRAVGNDGNVQKLGETLGLSTPDSTKAAIGGIMLDQRPFDIGQELAPAQAAINAQNQLAQSEQAITSPAKMLALKQQADAVAGRGPTLAEVQMKAAGDRSLAQQMAALQSNRGGNISAMQRNLAKGISTTGRDIAQKAAEARINERDKFVQQAGAQDDRALDLTRQKLEVDTAGKRSLQDFERARSGASAQQSALLQQGDASRAKAAGGLLSGIVGAFGSDERIKKDVKSGDKNVDEFLSALSAKNYKYKDTTQPGTAEGPRVGILAQDLEKSDMGKTMVKEVNGTKMVDPSQGFGAVLAAQARLNDRLSAIENKKKLKKA